MNLGKEIPLRNRPSHEALRLYSFSTYIQRYAQNKFVVFHHPGHVSSCSGVRLALVFSGDELLICENSILLSSYSNCKFFSNHYFVLSTGIWSRFKEHGKKHCLCIDVWVWERCGAQFENSPQFSN